MVHTIVLCISSGEYHSKILEQVTNRTFEINMENICHVLEILLKKDQK